MKIGFYIVGKKGYSTLVEYVKKYRKDSVLFVVAARDSGVDNDWFTDIVSFCSECDLFFVERNSVNDELILSKLNADISFAIGWKWVVNNYTNLVVFHDSLLPKYRGFAPLVNMLIDGVKEIGVTALIASDQYDNGEIITQLKKSISYPKIISEAIDEIIPLYVELLIEVVNEIYLTGTLVSAPQDENRATYSLWRDDMDYFIEWDQNAEKIRRFVDAVCAPYRGAAVHLRGKKLRVFEVEPVQDVVVEDRKTNLGKVIFMKNGCPVVVCAQGLLQINDLRAENNESLIGKIPFRSRFTK